MAKHTSHQLRNFVYGLEEKKRNIRYHNEYVNSSFIEKITIKVKKYLNSLYLNSSGDNFYGFDFEIDEEDIDYFIRKYKPKISEQEKIERKQELANLKRDKEKLDQKLKNLENECK